MPNQQTSLFDVAPEPWELDASREQLAACIVFAEQPFGPYDYGVPPAMAAKLKPGQRVQVPLGKGNRLVVGYCTSINMKPAGQRPLKPVARLIDAEPLVSANLLRLAEWIAGYY